MRKLWVIAHQRNQPAIEFYKKYNTHFEDDWITCKIEKHQLTPSQTAES
jgi:hypothetical protein